MGLQLSDQRVGLPLGVARVHQGDCEKGLGQVVAEPVPIVGGYFLPALGLKTNVLQLREHLLGLCLVGRLLGRLQTDRIDRAGC